MGVVNRFRQIAQLIGILTILGGIAIAGIVAYLWWDSRQTTQEYEFDTETETSSVSTDETDDEDEDVTEASTESATAETA